MTLVLQPLKREIEVSPLLVQFFGSEPHDVPCSSDLESFRETWARVDALWGSVGFEDVPFCTLSSMEQVSFTLH